MNMQMRVPSAYELTHPGNHLHRKEIPSEGTKIRAVFDSFYPPLNIVSIKDLAWLTDNKTSTIHSYLVVLRDIYGLDIRKRSVGHYWLVGEWFPKGYLDYADESYKELGKLKQ